MNETKYGYVIDSQGYPIFKNSFYILVQQTNEETNETTYVPEGYTLKPDEQLIMDNVQIPNAMLKPRWYKNEWIETATPEEIEAAKPPLPPPIPVNAGELTFVLLSESGEIDDVTITENAHLFPEWDEFWTGDVSQVVVDPDDRKIYRKIKNNFDEPNASSQPSKDIEQWVLIGDPFAARREWSRPIGKNDGYDDRAKVTCEGENYINTFGSGNMWKPGVHGWDVG